MANVYVLGGFQTDFATNWSRAGKSLFEIMGAAVLGSLESTDIESGDVDDFHVGNFTGELFSGQGHLGGLVASIDPAFAGRPTARHEAACASGSVAALAASANVECGRAELSCVIGVEQMKTVGGIEAADHLGAAAWRGREAEGARFLWPHMFDLLAAEYDRRYGLDYRHLMEVARTNFENARANPNAQSRGWTFTEASFTEDLEANPPVEGRIRRQDCGQITDGAAAVLLASPAYAKRYADRRGISLSSIPLIRGWGHRTAPMLFSDKLDAAVDGEHLFPHVRGAIEDARRGASLASVEQIDGAEVHDCFTITEYMLIEHLGLAAPGEAWKAIENGDIKRGGSCPINSSGGLIGAGHPVGATGVRMLLDAYKQVTGTAGDYQIDDAEMIQTVNIGGSATTTVSFVVGTSPS